MFSNYSHVNKYKVLQVAQYQPDVTSSDYRTTRINQFPPPSNRVRLLFAISLTRKEIIVSILGDTDDKEYPLYRDGKAPDDSYTAATFFVSSANLTGTTPFAALMSQLRSFGRTLAKKELPLPPIT
jgi:hypothetical protein